MEEVCPYFYLRIFMEKETAKMRNRTSKKKQSNIGSFCRKVLVPSFAGAVYAIGTMSRKGTS